MSNQKPRTTRRQFIARAAAAATGLSLGLPVMGAPAPGRVLGANERIRVGFIGAGNRGTQLMERFMQFPQVEVAALCDVYEPYLHRDRSRMDPTVLAALDRVVPRMGETFPGRVERYKDFRRLLEQPDIDAVCISTPDHWHAIQTIMACEAGKDVYIEKPVSLTVVEGRKMVEAAKRTGRVVAVGLNRRGSSVYQAAAEAVSSGKIGKVSLARAYRINNMYPDGIGNAQPEAPPATLDWDLWLGPAPFRPYQRNITPYWFRWWSDYSSQMANWGAHFLDLISWSLGEPAPIAVSAHGGNHFLSDDRTIPDTMEATFEFASGALAVLGVYEATGGPVLESGDTEFRGTLGNLQVGRVDYRIIPHGGGQFQARGPLLEGEQKSIRAGDFGAEAVSEDMTTRLIGDFLDCMKTRRQPLCDIEAGHRSTTFSHLANIALKTKTRLEWDSVNEQVTNCPAANDLLHYEYRKPWSLEI